MAERGGGALCPAANEHEEPRGLLRRTRGITRVMSPFEFSSVGKIVFGRGKIAQLGELARGLGSVALVIHNGDDPGNGGPVDRAAASLAAASVPVLYHRQRGEPTIADVDAGLAAARV